MIEKIVNIEALKEWAKLMFGHVRIIFYIVPTLLAIYAQITGKNVGLTPPIWSVIAFVSIILTSFTIYQESFKRYIGQAPQLETHVRTHNLVLKELLGRENYKILPVLPVEFSGTIEVLNYVQQPMLIDVFWNSITTDWKPLKEDLSDCKLEIKTTTNPNKQGTTGTPFNIAASDKVIISITVTIPFKSPVIENENTNWIQYLSKMEMNLELKPRNQKAIQVPIEYNIERVNQDIENRILDEIQRIQYLQKELTPRNEPRDLKKEFALLLKKFWTGTANPSIKTYKVNQEIKTKK